MRVVCHRGQDKTRQINIRCAYALVNQGGLTGADPGFGNGGSQDF